MVLWEVSTGRESALLKGYELRVSFSPDGAMVATGGAGGQVRVWDVASHREITVLCSEPATHVHNFVLFSRDGKLLAAGTKVWETRSWKEVHIFAADEDFIDSFAFAPGGTVAAIGTNHGVFQLLDMAAWRQLRTIDRQSGAVNTMDFSADGKLLAAGSGNGTIKVWETDTYHEVASVIAHATRYQKYGHVTAVEFLPNGVSIASTGDDGIAKIWQLT